MLSNLFQKTALAKELNDRAKNEIKTSNPTFQKWKLKKPKYETEKTQNSKCLRGSNFEYLIFFFQRWKCRRFHKGRNIW